MTAVAPELRHGWNGQTQYGEEEEGPEQLSNGYVKELLYTMKASKEERQASHQEYILGDASEERRTLYTNLSSFEQEYGRYQLDSVAAKS